MRISTWTVTFETPPFFRLEPGAMMLGCASAFPRHVLRPGLACIFAPRKEGAGKAGCPSHPQPRMQNEKAYELVTTGLPRSSGLPCAMVLTGSFALSLVTGLVCHHRKRKISSANLTPASGRQDHTTSPSALVRLVQRAIRVHRIPLPTSVTIASRPSLRERDSHRYAGDLGVLKTGKFLPRGLDS